MPDGIKDEKIMEPEPGNAVSCLSPAAVSQRR